MEVVVFAGLAFAVNKTVSVIKSLLSPDRNAAVTQLVVWVVGFFALLLASVASVTEALVLPGFTAPLSEVDVASIVFLAWVLGGSGSFVYDFKKAFDGSDSAAEPRLLPPRTASG